MKGEKNFPDKTDALRAFACIIDYMYFFDENTTVNGTVAIMDATHYSLKMTTWMSMEDRRDFMHTWQVRTVTYFLVVVAMTTTTNRQDLQRLKRQDLCQSTLLLGLEPVSLMIKKSRLRWFGHVERKDDNASVKRCITWEVEGIGQRGRPKKTWWDCVKNDMESLGLSQKDAQATNKWTRRIKGATG